MKRKFLHGERNYDKKFIDNLLEEIYNRYYDKAKTGFGRIKLNV